MKGKQSDPTAQGIILPDSFLMDRSDYITTRARQNPGFWPGQLEIMYEGHLYPYACTASLLTAPNMEPGPNFGRVWCITCAHNFTKRENVNKKVTKYDAISGKLFVRRT